MQFEDLDSDGTSQTFEERFKAALTKAPPLHEVEKDLAKRACFILLQHNSQLEKELGATS